MVVKWRMDCIHAPKSIGCKHCEVDNSDKIKDEKERSAYLARQPDPSKHNVKKSRKRGFVNKGFYGCARRCSLYEVKEIISK